MAHPLVDPRPKPHHSTGLIPPSGQAVTDPVIDIGLRDPALHRRFRDPEISRDFRTSQIAPTSDRDHITLELRRELLGHQNILPAGHRPAQRMSTNPAADPLYVVEDEVVGCDFREPFADLIAAQTQVAEASTNEGVGVRRLVKTDPGKATEMKNADLWVRVAFFSPSDRKRIILGARKMTFLSAV